MKRLFAAKKTQPAPTTPIKAGKKRLLITSATQLEAVLSDKKKPRRLYLAGDAVSLSVSGLPEGIVEQPPRTVDGNLLAKTKASLHVGLSAPVMETIKKGKAEKKTFLLVDNIIRWSLQRLRKERSFGLYCLYLQDDNYLVERYRFVDRKLYSIDQRIFHGEPNMHLVINLLEDDLLHPAYLASQDDLGDMALPEGISPVGDKPFRHDTHRELDFGKGKSYVKEYALPATVVAAAIMSFYGVKFWQQTQLNALQQQFTNTIAGMEDSYYSGGKEISLLERQQYFLEDSTAPQQHMNEQLRQVIGMVSELRQDSDYRLLTLDSVRVPASSPQWDMEFAIKLPESERMSRSLQSEQLVRKIAAKTGWEVITLRPPSQANHNGMDMLMFHLGAKKGAAS